MFSRLHKFENKQNNIKVHGSFFWCCILLCLAVAAAAALGPTGGWGVAALGPFLVAWSWHDFLAADVFVPTDGK